MKPIHYLLFMPAVLLLMLIFYLHFHKQLINRNDKIIYGLFIIPIMIICCQFPVVMVFLFYAAISFLVFDLFRKLRFIPADTLYLKGFMPFMIAFVLVVWGSFNYSDLVMTSYDIKVSGLKNDYTIMMISDLHLGKGASVERLQDIIDRVNKNNIDLFIMAGDIFDEGSSKEIKNETISRLEKVQTKEGIYYIEGNHDELDDETRKAFQSAGVVTLEDERVLIADDFYLIGKYYERDASDINWLLKEDKPCVLVDHVPHVYENVDLQLSGHTHAGQILPLGFVLDTGLHKTEQGYRITSSGAGAWGMKNRLGSKCEIVFINLHS